MPSILQCSRTAWLGSIGLLLVAGGPSVTRILTPQVAGTSMDFCQTPAAVQNCAPGTATENLAWFRANFGVGPAIPSTGTSYVSQGLGYWPAKDWLIVSLSEGPDSNRIAIKHRSTKAFVKFLYPLNSLGGSIGGHLGGLSVSVNHLWLSTATAEGNHVVYRIPLTAVAAAPNSGGARANRVWNVGVSSYNSFYATGAGNYLYVGHFNSERTGSSWMYRYLLSSTEDLIEGSRITISTPTQVQGVTVADGYYIFSTSYGKCCYSKLWFRNISTGAYGRSIQIPPMSEGIVRVPRGAAGWADDLLYVNFESGSSRYVDSTPLVTKEFRYALITTLTP